ncbi:Outer membrane porin F precursor [compost metagenome]
MELKLVILLLISLVASGRTSAQELGELKLMDSIPVSFESGSSLIQNPSQLIKRLNETKIRHGKIELIAYTDTIGRISYNKNLASNRLLAVSKLLDSTDCRHFIRDSTNQNEKRSVSSFDDKTYRRVDILIYSVIPKIKFGVPVNLEINFYPETVNIIKNSMKHVEMLQIIMETDPTLQVKLSGHVCCHPDLILSLHRAEKVKSYLTRHGIHSSRITCNGYSNTVKLVPETSEENKTMNRRVEVVFVK